ncbi:MAG TPA: YolD-like family protein [Acholeplasmataceae bacterium]|nr:YolD-like family protein [Acholeplasmataceae bacterium]
MQNKKKVDRAKQFLPFDALKGFREALREKEKIIVSKIILSKEEAEILSKKILQIKKNEIITVIYYNDGSYIELEGMVSKVDFHYKSVTIVKTEILFSDLLDVQGKCIVDLENKFF